MLNQNSKDILVRAISEDTAADFSYLTSVVSQAKYQSWQKSFSGDAKSSDPQLQHYAAAFGNLRALKLLFAHDAIVDFDCSSLECVSNDRKYSIKCAGSPLMLAIAHNQIAAAEFLIDIGADIEFHSKYTTESPLSLAVQFGNLELVKLLVERGALFYKNGTRTVSELKHRLSGLSLSYQQIYAQAKSAWQSTSYYAASYLANYLPTWSFGRYLPLHLAIVYGRLDMVRYFITKGAELNLQLSGNYSSERSSETLYGYPLTMALLTNDLLMLRVLLQAGAKPNMVDISCRTPLCVAQSSEAVQLLLQSGADLEQRIYSDKFNNWTALCYACYYGNLEVVKALVAHGADVNVQIKSDEIPFNVTPLYIAIILNNSPEIASVLIRAGADLKTMYGSSAILPLAFKHNVDISIFIELLVFYSGVDSQCVEALQGLNLSLDIIEACFWLQKNYQDQKQPRDVNCVHYLLSSKSALPIKCLCVLLAMGVDINQADQNGDTVLHRLAYGSADRTLSRQFVRDFIALIANTNFDIMRLNNNGATAFDIALRFQDWFLCNCILALQPDLSGYEHKYLLLAPLLYLDIVAENYTREFYSTVELFTLQDNMHLKKDTLTLVVNFIALLMQNRVDFRQVVRGNITFAASLHACNPDIFNYLNEYVNLLNAQQNQTAVDQPGAEIIYTYAKLTLDPPPPTLIEERLRLLDLNDEKLAAIDIPVEFCCPISHLLMRDPVLTANNCTYDRANISRWFAEGHNTDPLHGNTVSNTNLRDDIPTRNQILAYLDQLVAPIHSGLPIIVDAIVVAPQESTRRSRLWLR